MNPYEMTTGKPMNSPNKPSFEDEAPPLNSVEAALFLKISTRTLHNLCSNGKIPYYKFGRLNRYNRSELAEMLQAEARGPRP